MTDAECSANSGEQLQRSFLAFIDGNYINGYGSDGNSVVTDADSSSPVTNQDIGNGEVEDAHDSDDVDNGEQSNNDDSNGSPVTPNYILSPAAEHVPVLATTIDGELMLDTVTTVQSESVLPCTKDGIDANVHDTHDNDMDEIDKLNGSLGSLGSLTEMINYADPCDLKSLDNIDDLHMSGNFVGIDDDMNVIGQEYVHVPNDGVETNISIANANSIVSHTPLMNIIAEHTVVANQAVDDTAIGLQYPIVTKAAPHLSPVQVQTILMTSPLPVITSDISTISCSNMDAIIHVANNGEQQGIPIHEHVLSEQLENGYQASPNQNQSDNEHDINDGSCSPNGENDQSMGVVLDETTGLMKHSVCNEFISNAEVISNGTQNDEVQNEVGLDVPSIQHDLNAETMPCVHDANIGENGDAQQQQVENGGDENDDNNINNDDAAVVNNNEFNGSNRGDDSPISNSDGEKDTDGDDTDNSTFMGFNSVPMPPLINRLLANARSLGEIGQVLNGQVPIVAPSVQLHKNHDLFPKVNYYEHDSIDTTMETVSSLRSILDDLDRAPNDVLVQTKQPDPVIQTEEEKEAEAEEAKSEAVEAKEAEVTDSQEAEAGESGEAQEPEAENAEEVVKDAAPVVAEPEKIIETPIEQPIVEPEATVEEPVDEMAAIVEAPVNEAPVVKKSVVRKSAIEKPVVEAPVEKTPVIEAHDSASAVKKPVVDEPSDLNDLAAESSTPSKNRPLRQTRRQKHQEIVERKELNKWPDIKPAYVLLRRIEVDDITAETGITIHNLDQIMNQLTKRKPRKTKTKNKTKTRGRVKRVSKERATNPAHSQQQKQEKQQQPQSSTSKINSKDAKRELKSKSKANTKTTVVSPKRLATNNNAKCTTSLNSSDYDTDASIGKARRSVVMTTTDIEEEITSNIIQCPSRRFTRASIDTACSDIGILSDGLMLGDADTSEGTKTKSRKRMRSRTSSTIDAKQLRIEESADLYCELCNTQFFRSHHFRNHFNMHSVREELYCNACDHPQFDRAIELNKHMLEVHAIVETECESCKTDFFGPLQLSKHLRSVHLIQNYRTHSCRVCSAAYTCRPDLVNHLLAHVTRTFICCICKKHFSSQITLKEHIQVHANDRSFQCYGCQRMLKTFQTLRRHMKIHCRFMKGTLENPIASTSTNKRHISDNNAGWFGGYA